MSQDILQELIRNPQDIFKLHKKINTTSSTENSVSDENIFNELTKRIINPIVKNYSVLDELYTDGLDSSQVFGQTKMVLEGIGSKLLGEEIPLVREMIGEEENSDEEENSEDVDGEEVEREGEVSEDSQSEGEGEGEGEDEQDEEEGSEDEQDEEEEDEEGKFSDDGETLVGGDEEDDEEARDDSDSEVKHKEDAFGLNDGFFDLDEYKKQVLALENQDTEGGGDDDEEIDYFGSLSDDEDEEDQMDYYDDFYDKPGKDVKTKLKDRASEGEEEDEDEDEDGYSEGEFADEDYDNAVNSARLDLFAETDDRRQKQASQGGEENLSSYEKQQLALQREIEKLEAELVADKKWTLKGEVTSNDRPKESLLEQSDASELLFDRTAKPVPTITQEVTETIEDLIRKRIKNDEFDDLPRRIVQDLSKFHQGPKADVSQQKSSKSLAELYEDEYNQVDAQQEELDDAVKKQHEEISELFTKVTHKLDALCSAHFIPKPHEVKNIEIKVTDASAPATSVSASIDMEGGGDAQPLSVSSESKLAPQEIYKIGDDAVKGQGVKGKSELQLKSGLSYSKDELNREEKQRLRRANKRKKSKQFNDREEYKRQKLRQQTPVGDKRANGNGKGRPSEVVDTLSKAKNISVIGQKGELRDVKGNLKKNNGPTTGNKLKL